MFSDFFTTQVQSTAPTTLVASERARQGWVETVTFNLRAASTPVEPRVASVLSVWDKLRKALGEIALLNKNWDGHGGAAISSEVARHARQLLDRLASLPGFPVPDITPTSSGTIGFEWESANMEAYIEIGRTRCSGYVRTGAGAPILIDGLAGQIDDQILGALVAAQRGNLASQPVFASLRTRSYSIDDRLAA